MRKLICINISVVFLFFANISPAEENVGIIQCRFPIREELAKAIKDIEKNSDFTLTEIIRSNAVSIEQNCANLYRTDDGSWIIEFASTDLNAQALIMWITKISYLDSAEESIRFKKISIEEIKSILMAGLNEDKEKILRNREIERKIKVYTQDVFGD